MSEQAKKKVVNTALGEVGTKESGSNINKYAAYIDKNYPDFYNGKKQGVEWCDIFVDYLFLYNFGEDNALKMLYQPKKSCGAGCRFSAGYYKSNGAWFSSPQIGDQVFFGTKGKESHTGIVVDISGNKFYTVEGNKKNMVLKCAYTMGDSYIAGFGRPKWSVIPDGPSPEPTPKGGCYMFDTTVVKKGTKGADTLLCQELLYAKGYKGKDGKPLAMDSHCGTNTVYAINSFQSDMRKKGIECGTNGKNDGSCGPKMWKALLGT